MHTRGPWKIRITPDDRTEYTEILSNTTPRFLVCTVGGMDVKHENANLISAAPDMLEILKETRDRMIGNSPQIKSLRERTDAAIAKALGK